VTDVVGAVEVEDALVAVVDDDVVLDGGSIPLTLSITGTST
jgi:hypothetical protein